MENSALPLPGGLTRHVTREILANGLTILVKENHAAPVAAVLVSVKAGYFQEADRVNGIAHVLEHMLFKGTPRRPADEQIAREVRELGGYINAGTYYEETSYYLTVPARRVESAMDILADACRNSLFDGEELAKEIEVIVQESLQKRDNPNAMLLESLYALAYDAHRIRRWRIGHPETLRAFRREDLLAFVQANYRPENMVLTIAGDVDAAQVLELARNLWSDLPRGENPREVSPTEPPRQGFRYQRLTGDTKQRLLLFAMPAPDTLHPDAAALMVLSALLSDGRSARLYRRLKEDLKVANSAWASYESFEQMGIFTLGAESVGDDPLAAERALWDEARRVQTDPIDANDLERIKTRIETRRLFGQEEVMGVARTLSHYEQLGDYHLADTLVERLRAITPADVQRVALAYLQLEQASLMEYLPAESSAPPSLSADALAAELGNSVGALLAAPNANAAPNTGLLAAPNANTIPNPQSTIANPERLNTRTPEHPTPSLLDLPGGGKLLYQERRDLPIVALNALFRGGKRREDRAIAGITNLMLKSTLKGALAKGTLPPLTAQEIANRIEGLGTGIGMSAGMDYFGWGMKTNKEVLREAFAVFAAVVTAPAFSAEEVEKEKQAIYAEIRRQQDSGYALSNDLFAAACYGDEHPYGLPAVGLAEAVAALSPEGLQNWHTAQVRPDNLIVSLVGDISAEEAVALVSGLWTEALGNREGVHSVDRGTGNSGSIANSEHLNARTPEYPTPNAQHPTPASLPAERVLYRQRQQTAAMLGFGGADMFSPDRYALDMLNEITSGMGGRLFRAVRGENSLAYQVTSFHRSRADVGNFVTYTSTAPENEARARELILNALRELQREPVTDEELRMAKASILGEHVINMQTFAAQAGELAVIGVYDLPLDEPERYLREIQEVTAEQIRDVANRYLDLEHSWLGVVRGDTTEGS